MTDIDVRFRPMRRDDLEQLAAWLRDPDVNRWWPTPAPDDVEADYGPSIDGDDPMEAFVVLVDGRDAGLIQRYRMEDEQEWREALATGGVAAATLADAAGIDYLIGEATARGRGAGTAMIAAFTALTFADWPDCERIVVAVLQENRASWRALERAGYHRVWEGILDSPDPSDDGPEYVLVRERPSAAGAKVPPTATATGAAPAP